MPATMIDHAVTITGKLPAAAKTLPMRTRGLLLLLQNLAHSSSEVCITERALAERLGYKTGGGHITRMIRQLQEARLVVVSRRRGDGARVNRYRITE